MAGPRLGDLARAHRRSQGDLTPAQAYCE